MSHRRNGKQVTEAKERPLELRRGAAGRKKRGWGRHGQAPERESVGWVLHLEGFTGWDLGEVLGEDLSRISTSFLLIPK